MKKSFEMDQLNLNQLGLDEISNQEMVEADGGFVLFLAGVAAGAVGMYVYENYIK